MSDKWPGVAADHPLFWRIVFLAWLLWALIALVDYLGRAVGLV